MLESSSWVRLAASRSSRKRAPSKRYSCMLFPLGEVLDVRPLLVNRLRAVRVARQLRAGDEEDLRDVLPEVIPDLGPLGGLEAYDHVRVHAQRFGQLLLRHEDPLPRCGQVRPVYLHRYTLLVSRFGFTSRFTLYLTPDRVFASRFKLS